MSKDIEESAEELARYAAETIGKFEIANSDGDFRDWDAEDVLLEVIGVVLQSTNHYAWLSLLQNKMDAARAVGFIRPKEGSSDNA